MRIGLFALFMMFSVSLFAQKDREQQALDLIEERIEYLTQAYEESEIDFTTLFDDLYFYYQNPLNLNEATREDLQSTYLFSDYQVTQLLKYRENYGDLKTQYELIHIPGFDKNSIQMLLPFVVIEPPKPKNSFPLKKAIKYGRHELIMRHQRVLQEAEGYKDLPDSVLEENPNAKYLGSRDRIYARYRFQYGKRISIGMTGEKDPGEEFFRGTQSQGFDFYSAHIFIRDLGPIKKLAIGDYQLQLAQGLTFWSGFGFRKSPAQTVDVKRYSQGLKPYTSTDENNFMRGAAAMLNYKNFDLTLFYSNKGIDGNIQFTEDTTDADQIGSFSSIQTSGLHRTPSELEDKNAVKEVIYGAALDYTFKKGKIGWVGVRTAFEPGLNRSLQHYQYFNFQGKENSNMGLNYQFTLNRFSLFGEGSLSENGGYATLNGAIMNLDSRFKLSVLQRYYSKDYNSLYSDGFGERSGASNESGVYFGTEFLPAKFFKVSAFYDIYTFPWLSYNIDKPGKGDEFSGMVTFKPMRKLEFVFLYRHEGKDRNYNPDEEAINPIATESKDRYRIQMTAKVNSYLTLRTRFETSQYKLGNQARKSGYMVYQDFYVDGFSNKLALKFRYALFSTPDYDTRIYAYENDLRYQFSVPAYYLRGSRVYAVVRWKITDNATFNFKISQTYLSNQDFFGSGKDLIESDTRTEVKTQFIFKF